MDSSRARELTGKDGGPIPVKFERLSVASLTASSPESPRILRLRAARDAAIAELERRKRLETEAEREKTNQLLAYQDDCPSFVEDYLYGFLWSKQQAIAQSVAANRQTAVPSCHDVGKTFCAAAIACWWIASHEPGEAFVVTMAPTAVQVDALLWREMNRIHAQGRLPGKMVTRHWKLDNGELVAFGRSPADTDPTAAQGIHAKYVLVLLDEACGIAKALWDAVSSLVANEFSRILAIGNPDDPSTEFEAVCRPGSGWNVIPISAFDSPNFTNEPVPDWLRPLLIGPTWVEERRRKWGEDSPLYKSKVLGQFPSEAADGLIPLSSITAAVTRRLPLGEENELGVDVARYGEDLTVIYHRRGPVARRRRKFGKRSTMVTVGEIIEVLRETGASVVRIDDTGVGGGVTDRLEELKAGADTSDGGILAKEILRTVTIIPVNVGEKPTVQIPDALKDPGKRFGETERYVRLKDQLNWGLRERFISGDIDLVSVEEDREQSEDIQAQAADIKYALTSTGQIQIESKDEIKKRGRPSPDDWDALVLVFATATRRKRVLVTEDMLQRARAAGQYGRGGRQISTHRPAWGGGRR